VESLCCSSINFENGSTGDVYLEPIARSVSSGAVPTARNANIVNRTRGILDCRLSMNSPI